MRELGAQARGNASATSRSRRIRERAPRGLILQAARPDEVAPNLGIGHRERMAGPQFNSMLAAYSACCGEKPWPLGHGERYDSRHAAAAAPVMYGRGPALRSNQVEFATLSETL